MNKPYFTVGSRKPEVVRIVAGVEALRVQTLNFIRTLAEPERRELMRSLFEVTEAPGENEAPTVFRLSQARLDGGPADVSSCSTVNSAPHSLPPAD